jgi:hypothetical protein
MHLNGGRKLCRRAHQNPLSTRFGRFFAVPTKIHFVDQVCVSATASQPFSSLITIYLQSLLEKNLTHLLFLLRMASTCGCLFVYKFTSHHRRQGATILTPTHCCVRVRTSVRPPTQSEQNLEWMAVASFVEWFPPMAAPDGIDHVSPRRMSKKSSAQPDL